LGGRRIHVISGFGGIWDRFDRIIPSMQPYLKAVSSHLSLEEDSIYH
jgi:hypothetical protein